MKRFTDWAEYFKNKNEQLTPLMINNKVDDMNRRSRTTGKPVVKPLVTYPAKAYVPPPPPVRPTRGAYSVQPHRFKLLTKLLTYKRVHNSETENAYIEKFIVKPAKALGLDPIMDSFGNVIIRCKAEESTTLFSCHTDTVHYTEGTQSLVYDETKQHMFLSELSSKAENYKGKSNCLGADDGACIFIMMEMLSACIPGTYVFHRDEESGGRGSRFIAAYNDTERLEWELHELDLRSFDRAIAFDRAGYTDVITSQGGQCASNKFAKQMAEKLNRVMDVSTWAPSPGVFTDTANYTKFISECTNLSVGYFKQHGPKEYLDVPWVMQLSDACICIDWEQFTPHRKLGESTKIANKRNPETQITQFNFNSTSTKWMDLDISDDSFRLDHNDNDMSYEPDLPDSILNLMDEFGVTDLNDFQFIDEDEVRLILIEHPLFAYHLLRYAYLNEY